MEETLVKRHTGANGNRMRVLLYADFRSPTARGWAEGLRGAGIEVRCVSSERVDDSFPAIQPLGAVSRLRQMAVRARDEAVIPPRDLIGRELRPSENLEAALALVRTHGRRRLLAKQRKLWSPDLVHALRLPYEGLTVLGIDLKIPLVVSTWGQDFVPQSENSPILKQWIRRSLAKADGIQYDAPVDLQRALSFGLRAGTPDLYAAGNFGIDTELFSPSAATRVRGHIVFPRGRAESANGRGFIRAVELLQHRSDLRFTAIGLRGISYAEKAASSPSLKNRLLLTSRLPRNAFAKVLSTADVMVSPTFSDGTPNSILEALACGVTVVAANIPSIANLQKEVGLLRLVDHGSDRNLATAISDAVGLPPVEATLPEHYSIRANYSRVIDFYARSIDHHAVAREKQAASKHARSY